MKHSKEAHEANERAKYVIKCCRAERKLREQGIDIVPYLDTKTLIFELKKRGVEVCPSKMLFIQRPNEEIIH